MGDLDTAYGIVFGTLLSLGAWLFLAYAIRLAVGG